MRCFIDDVIDIWIPSSDPDPERDAREWTAFKLMLNDWHSLIWDVIEPTESVDFMDITISIR
eukprot:12527322-Ditylum_brightwellii.AAC.1